MNCFQAHLIALLSVSGSTPRLLTPAIATLFEDIQKLSTVVFQSSSRSQKQWFLMGLATAGIRMKFRRCLSFGVNMGGGDR